MKIGAFDVDEPLPELHEPHALAVIRPWIDTGNSATLTLNRIEVLLQAKELGRIARPETFFDFTRYRPVMYLKRNKYNMVIPNTYITYATRDNGNDFLFLHLLEPHMLGQTYVDSVLKLLTKMGVERFCVVGSMYDFVPHTRPLMVSGGGMSKKAEAILKKAGVQSSEYEGPTSITTLISQKAADYDIESMTMIVHLPQYSQLEDDYTGQVRLMEVIGKLYSIPVSDADIRQAEEQRKRIDEEVADSPQVKDIVAQLENIYDSRSPAGKEKESESTQLSPQIEKFLKEIEKRFRQEK